MTDLTQSSVLDLARSQLRRIIEGLLQTRYELMGVQTSIPPTRQETSPDNLDSSPDAATEIRSVIGNCINDCLDPMIRDLGTAMAYQPPTEGRHRDG